MAQLSLNRLSDYVKFSDFSTHIKKTIIVDGCYLAKTKVHKCFYMYTGTRVFYFILQIIFGFSTYFIQADDF